MSMIIPAACYLQPLAIGAVMSVVVDGLADVVGICSVYRTNQAVNVFYDAKKAKKTAEREARREARRLKRKGKKGVKRKDGEAGPAASAASPSPGPGTVTFVGDAQATCMNCCVFTREPTRRHRASCAVYLCFFTRLAHDMGTLDVRVEPTARLVHYHTRPSCFL